MKTGKSITKLVAHEPMGNAAYDNKTGNAFGIVYAHVVDKIVWNVCEDFIIPIEAEILAR